MCPLYTKQTEKQVLKQKKPNFRQALGMSGRHQGWAGLVEFLALFHFFVWNLNL